MNLKNKKRIAAKILRIGKNRIKLDSSKLPEIKEAITKSDIRALISSHTISTKPLKGHSRFRTRKVHRQKRKGKRKGFGSRKGKKTARLKRKRTWISRVRTQRKFIKNLKEKKLISKQVYRDLYVKIKSNRFRNVHLIKLYIQENNLINKNDRQKKI